MYWLQFYFSGTETLLNTIVSKLCIIKNPHFTFNVCRPHVHMYHITVKRFGYFNYILVTSVAFLFCVWHVKFKKCLEFEQNVVKKLSPFVKLVSPFRKPYTQHFWWSLLFLWSWRSAYWEFLQVGCMAMVNNIRNVTKRVFWNKRQANVTKEKFLNGLSRKPT